MDPSVKKSEDYLIKYKSISDKLKKRFLRKPNIAEAGEQFGELQRALSDDEVWSGAGLCCIALARCHHTLSATAPELQALLHAARSFAKAEHSSRNILCPSLSEHVLTSSSCYQRAKTVCSALDGSIAECTASSSQVNDLTSGGIVRCTAAVILLEEAKSLERCDHCFESVSLIQSAVNHLAPFPAQHLMALELQQHSFIMIGDLHAALMTSATIINTYGPNEENNKFAELPTSIKDAYFRCEVLTIELLLLLRPLEHRTSPALLKVMEQYSVVQPYNMEASKCSEELQCLLQCLILAVRDFDDVAVKELCIQLTALLQHLPMHLHLLLLITLHSQYY